MSERLDKYMVDTNMVLTRSQARMLIKQGDVFVNDKKILKSGHSVSEKDQIEIKERKLYVSRGAYKLVHAIEAFEIDFNNLVVMDCGASTGGFTQVCIEHHAQKIFAIDVGHDQLSEILKNDDRVVNYEGINLKNKFELNEKCDCFVMDISFISIKLVLDNIIPHLKATGFGVLLVKPQFEIGKEKVGKGGIVAPDDGELCAKEVHQWLKSKFSKVSELIPCSIKGKTGNQEYLVKVEL